MATIEIEMHCEGKKHKAYLDDGGVIHSECNICNGMLSGDCEIVCGE